MACCPPGRVALMPPDSYKPVGQKTTFGAVAGYTVGKPGSSAVVVVPDIFGMDSGRHYGIADHFANEGYYVVMVDLPVGPKPSMAEVMGKIGEVMKANHPTNHIAPVLDLVYAHLQAQGVTKIGMIGMCYGSWVVFSESARNAPIVAGVNCHPSIRLEGMFGGSAETIAQRANHPMLLFPCANDPDDLKKGGAVEKIFAEKKIPLEIFEFSAQQHGFVSQGNMTDEKVGPDVAVAIDRATAYLKAKLA